MRLILRAHSADWLALAGVILTVGLITAQSHDSGQFVLDLTKPRPAKEELRGLPGGSIGGIEGIGQIPHPYELPLAVKLDRIAPKTLQITGEFRVEVDLRNTGSRIFWLPASVDSASVLKKGNKGRRTLLFCLVFEDPAGRVKFEDPAGNPHKTWLMASADGSESVAGSLVPIPPGRSTRVVFKGDLKSIRPSITPELSRLKLCAAVKEWSYEDNHYFIKNRSQTVVSDNCLTLDLID